MGLRLVLDGFDSFADALRTMPESLAAEAAAIVHASAEGAMRTITAGYPIRTDGPKRRIPKTQEPMAPRERFKVRNQMRRPQTPPGALRAGMRIAHADRALRPRSIVRNVNPLAHIFEDGTQARHTALGAYRGTMPPGHVFIPNAIRARRAMDAALVALLRANDFRVSGAA